MPDGRIEPRQVRRLLEIGKWLKKYGESIYATSGGPFKPGPWGASTRRDNIIYLHLLKPPGEKLTLPSFKNAVVKASLLTGGEVSVTKNDDSLTVTVPEKHLQDIDTIVKLEIDGPAANLGVLDTRIKSGSLASGKKAKASNVYRKMNGSYGPDKALDDDPDTRWATDAGVREAWLEVNLGKRCRIARAVVCEAYAGRIRKFELQAGTGGEWKTFYRGTKIGEKGVFEFEPVSTQNVRLNILEAEDGPTICEFRLFPPGK
jgi:alpha-L-fucosidase